MFGQGTGGKESSREPLDSRTRSPPSKWKCLVQPNVVFIGLRSGPAQQTTAVLFYTHNFPILLVAMFTALSAPPPFVTAPTRARGGRRKI